nr:PREDICTED: RNA-directed DNA polymerase from mobile element jockey-like [Linepithema humile]
MANTIKIMSWNANGLLNHQQELQATLDINKIDVCLISETHFTKQSFIKFRGYKVYQTIHPGNAARGGRAIIVKDNIYHNEEVKIEAEDIQATVLNIKAKKYNIVVVSLYSPSKHNIKAERYFELFKNIGNRFIIGGDFNAKHTHWGSRLITTKGRELLKAINKYKCEVISTGKPTYWPTDADKISGLIDFYISKNISSNYMKIEDNLELSLDHSPIILTLSESIIQKPRNPVMVNKKTGWEGFRMTIEERIQLTVPLQTEEQLDFEVEKFVNDIQQSAWENTPEIKRKLKGNNYPKEILKLISEKRKARKKWHQTRAPQDKARLNKLTSQIKEEIKQLKNDTISEFLRGLTNDSSTEYSLWKATKNSKDHANASYQEHAQ